MSQKRKPPMTLEDAICFNDESTVRTHLSEGVDVNNIEDGSSCLYKSLHKPVIFDLILAHPDTDVNLRFGVYKWTILQSVCSGDLETIGRLLDRGADPSIQDSDGDTIFHTIATLCYSLEKTIDLLIERGGADALFIKNNNGTLCFMQGLKNHAKLSFESQKAVTDWTEVVSTVISIRPLVSLTISYLTGDDILVAFLKFTESILEKSKRDEKEKIW